MFKDEKYNQKEENQENETQKLFEEGMPESTESKAIPSSLDELSADEHHHAVVAPEWSGEDTEDRLTELEKKYEKEILSYESPDIGMNEDGRGAGISKEPAKKGAKVRKNEQRKIVSGAGQLSSEAHSHIKGWGIDADPSNDPVYPIKNRTNEEQLGNTWKRPTLQEQNVELLMSNERNSLPAVFSNEEPPKGLSGMLKRKAFKYSESDYRHWLALMASDKIGVLEGKLDDLRHGHIPNPIAERGLKSEWKYNRKEFVKKSAIKLAVTGAAIGLILLSRRKRSAA